MFRSSNGTCDWKNSWKTSLIRRNLTIRSIRISRRKRSIRRLRDHMMASKPPSLDHSSTFLKLEIKVKSLRNVWKICGKCWEKMNRCLIWMDLKDKHTHIYISIYLSISLSICVKSIEECCFLAWHYGFFFGEKCAFQQNLFAIFWKFGHVKRWDCHLRHLRFAKCP